MSKVILIRHAQSANNAQPEHLRVCDPSITELGKQQAQATAEALATHNLRRLYCSPFLRSLETTRAIAQRTGLRPHIHAELFEEGGCYSGHLPGQERGEPGMGRSQLSELYPDWEIDQRIADDGWWGQPLESTDQARQRARLIASWLESEALYTNDGVTAMVIHADFKRHLLSALLGSQWQQLDAQLGPLHNTGMTMLEYRPTTWIVHCYNSITHLPSAMLSC